MNSKKRQMYKRKLMLKTKEVNAKEREDDEDEDEDEKENKIKVSSEQFDGFPFKSIHVLVEQHERRNRIYSLSVLHIEHNEMDSPGNNAIVYVYNTSRNL